MGSVFKFRFTSTSESKKMNTSRHTGMNTYTVTGTVASVSGSMTSVWPFAQMLNVVSI